MFDGREVDSFGVQRCVLRASRRAPPFDPENVRLALGRRGR